MGKQSGGSRIVKNGSREYSMRLKEVAEMQQMLRFESVTMSEKGGGYVAIERSNFKHKKEELEAARILADKGYKVILKNETSDSLKVKSPDGYLFNVSFEQRTPTKDGANTIRNALNHAKSKRADIALIYSNQKIFSRKSVEEGIVMFENQSDYRFNSVIVVSDSGNIHIHKHNK